MAKGGSGANTGFIIGKSGVVMIDAKMTRESTAAVLGEVKKLTQNPVKAVVLTHGDGDHVNGLTGMPRGVPIIAHANTRNDMAEAFKDPKLSSLIPYIPSDAVTASRTAEVGGVKMRLLYFGPAHTSGDLVILLPAQRIAFLGDLAFVGRDPLIHRRKGGNSAGLVRVLKNVMTLDADTFVTGHSEPLRKADIQNLVTSIEEKQAKVKGLMAQGKSLDEILAAFGQAGAPGQSPRRFSSLVEVIYQELSEKK